MNIFLIILFTIFSSENEIEKSSIKETINIKDENNLIEGQKPDSIAILWNEIVKEKGGCLLGAQYVSDKNTKKIRHEAPDFVFNQESWEKFIRLDKLKLTDFLIDKLSDSSKTKVHTCPFFSATVGEVAVYALQRIYQLNWYDFNEFKRYRNKETTSSIEQPQMWLQKLLKDENERKKLAKLYRNEFKK